MSENNSHICVGGPRDGERVAVPPGHKGFRAVVPKNLPRLVEATFDTIEYVEHILTGDIGVWAPSTMTLQQVTECVLTGYQANAKVSKRLGEVREYAESVMATLGIEGPSVADIEHIIRLARGKD